MSLQPSRRPSSVCGVKIKWTWFCIRQYKPSTVAADRRLPSPAQLAIDFIVVVAEEKLCCRRFRVLRIMDQCSRKCLTLRNSGDTILISFSYHTSIIGVGADRSILCRQNSPPCAARRLKPRALRCGFRPARTSMRRCRLASGRKWPEK